ncbi:RNA polymerase sigma factor [Roseibium sp.]|uniref:RNA polymerase sigma factor n=1 Tax=Roseibium sp. TaxID=1936156 RepID=UPI003B516FBA
MDSQLSDEELVEAAAAGNAGAFGWLLERHYDTIFRFSYRLLGHREDAEDLAQDVCSALAVKLSSFKRRSSFTTWLYRIVLNAARDRHRRRVSFDKAAAGFGEVDALRRAEWAEAGDQIAWLYETLEAIGGDFRETAVLVLGEEMTHAQAAEVLSVRESTISWRMSKLKDTLKTLAKAEA